MFKKEEFATDLLIFRIGNNMSRHDLYKKIDIPVSTLQVIEEGRFMPNLINYYKLCNFMKVEPNKYIKL
jgi:DNA-binding XRE family transcriptional regulator